MDLSLCKCCVCHVELDFIRVISVSKNEIGTTTKAVCLLCHEKTKGKWDENGWVSEND
jgi:hypothetical protein